MRVDLRDADERLGYFAWAVEQSNSTRSLAFYMTAPNSNSEAAIEWLKKAIASDLYGRSISYRNEEPWNYAAPGGPRSRPLTMEYATAVGGFPDSSDQRGQFGADVEQSTSADVEDTAYRLMLICFLGMLDGNSDALRWLTTLMVRGGPNRQLTISRFLALTTFERVGDLTGLPPDRDAVLGWAREVSSNVPLEGVLPYMVAEYMSRAHRNS